MCNSLYIISVKVIWSIIYSVKTIGRIHEVHAKFESEFML